MKFYNKALTLKKLTCTNANIPPLIIVKVRDFKKKTDLILKNIITPEDWESLNDHIQYDFIYDNQFAELKESELMNERLGTLATIEPYIGKY